MKKNKAQEGSDRHVAPPRTWIGFVKTLAGGSSSSYDGDNRKFNLHLLLTKRAYVSSTGYFD